MKTETFHLELITPCFCGGAEPEKQAEIRAPSIRGQLRWWFRTLGGFKSLAPMPLREQEALIFGSTAGEEGQAGKVVVRVLPASPGETLTASADHPTPNMNDPEGYLLFPLRQQVRKKSALQGFKLTVQWRGAAGVWDDLKALVAVFGHLGALGFRGTRAMGALAFAGNAPDLEESLKRFERPSNIVRKQISKPAPLTQEQCVQELATWLRSWRQHGQMSRRWDKQNSRWVSIGASQQAQNRSQPGFRYARRDHNEGLDVQGTGAPNPDPENPAGQPGETFRSALGLPIIQYFSSLADPRGGQLKRSQATVNWTLEDGARLASPVLLRPHRDSQGNWRALVIFLDQAVRQAPGTVVLTAKRWNNASRTEEEHARTRRISTALYELMRDDLDPQTRKPRGILRSFP